MTNEQIKKIALACGFKLKEQPDGSLDLNPYVYDFARELIKQNQQSAWVSVEDALPELDTPIFGLIGKETAIYVRVIVNNEWFWARCTGNSSIDNYGEWLLDDDYQLQYWRPLFDLHPTVHPDTARLDWIEETFGNNEMLILKAGTGRTYRQAIDKAMQSVQSK